jgi:hypothetical protein
VLYVAGSKVSFSTWCFVDAFAVGIDMATVLLIVTSATEVRNLRRDMLVLLSGSTDGMCEVI